MSDLISRSALMQSLRNNVLVDVTPNLEQAIDEQPSAYDVDKVVERLGILSDRADDKIMEQEGSEQYWDGFGDGIDEAIKILKSGGID